MKPPRQRCARIRRSQWRAFVLGTAILAGACGGRTAASPFRAQVAGAPAVLEVENRHWTDMTISVRRGTRVVRLGLVTTNNSKRFRIPPEAGAAGMSVTFLADPVGSGTVYESPIVTLGAGEGYLWTLAVALEQSTLVRR